MMETVLLDQAFGETRLAIADDAGRLLELHHFRAEEPDRTGEIHVARVHGVAPAFDGAFVTLEDGGQAFLKTGRRRRPVEGSLVALRIRGEPGPDKLPLATLDIGTPGVAIPENPGAPACLHRERWPWARVLRSLDPERTGAVITDAPEIHTALAAIEGETPWLSGRVTLARPAGALFRHHGVEDEIAALWSPDVPLGMGARLHVEETCAVTAIDVDAGGLGAGRDMRATARKVNMRAVREIARQLRLRRPGGLVVVDFLRMAAADRASLLVALDHAMEVYPGEWQRGGFTRFGLLELVLTRLGRPLLAELAGPLPAPSPNMPTLCRMALRAATAAAERRPGLPVTIAGHPDLVRALAAMVVDNRPIDRHFLTITGSPLLLRSEPALDRTRYSAFQEDTKP